MRRPNLPLLSLIVALTTGCSSTFTVDNPCPEGTERRADQCIPSTVPVSGCTDPFAENYSPRATIDDGSCTFSGVGCTDAAANNYNPTATTDDGSCRYDGCTDAAAVNFDDTATDDDGTCRYIATLRVDMNGVTDFAREDGVYVHGSFNNWCGTCAVLTDGDNDGVFRGTIVLTAETHRLRFVIGSDPLREESLDASCGVDAEGGLARTLTMPAENTTFEPLEFGRCPAVSGELPLVVDDVWAPSGFMGDGESGGITASEVCPTRAGEGTGFCHAFDYTPGGVGWGGVFWQYPDGNWGDLDGFPVPAGATRINFWAWGAQGGEVVKFLAGIQAADGFALETPDITLASTPTEYQILLVGTTYNEIVGGFGWVAAAPGGGGSIEFYVDDIQYQAVPSDIGGGGDGCTDDDATNYDPNAMSDDGSCEYDVTFSVDMSCAGEAFTAVFVTGPFCSWCANGFELLDPDQDGVFTGTFAFGTGPLEFKYMVDEFTSQENLVDDVVAGNGACAPITDGVNFANRQVQVVDAPLTTSDAYGRCDACP